MKKVYISGPITGIKNKNREAFDAEESRLRNMGFKVFNPQTLARFAWMVDGEPDEVVWQFYMKHCVRMIPECDEMRMLAHWQNSRGAVWEHKIANMLGLRVTYCPVPDTRVEMVLQSKKLNFCAANRDGDCSNQLCPQHRDNEPATSHRPCPLPDYQND